MTPAHHCAEACEGTGKSKEEGEVWCIGKRKKRKKVYKKEEN